MRITLAFGFIHRQEISRDRSSRQERSCPAPLAFPLGGKGRQIDRPKEDSSTTPVWTTLGPAVGAKKSCRWSGDQTAGRGTGRRCQQVLELLH